MIPTIRIAAPVSDDNPLGFVVVNEADFDPETMERWEEPKGSAALTVAQLKAALDAKGVPVPEGAKKAELVALLDGAA